MAENIIDMIVLQDKLKIIPTVEITHETQIKGHHTYKSIRTPHLEVQRKLENVGDKYPVCA